MAVFSKPQVMASGCLRLKLSLKLSLQLSLLSLIFCSELLFAQESKHLLLRAQTVSVHLRSDSIR